MRPIPLLAEEGAERERDSAKPQEWLRHQKNAAKPQRRRRHPSSARRGMCAPKNFVQKTKSCSLVTQRGNRKGTKGISFLCLLGLFCAFYGSFPVFQGLTETLTRPVVQQHWNPPPPSPE